MTTRRDPEGPTPLQQIVDAIGARRRFVVSSHSRPDGDSIGSSMSMALALRALGKEARASRGAS
jgi:phosphoesterase RecJ-like protein